MKDVDEVTQAADNITRQQAIFDENDPNYNSPRCVHDRNLYAEQLIHSTSTCAFDRVIEALDGPGNPGPQRRKQFLRSRAIHFSDLYEGLMEILGGEGSLEERFENWEKPKEDG